jgi:trehalose/maltose hydrolase-like predicted phosphorylase
MRIAAGALAGVCFWRLLSPSLLSGQQPPSTAGDSSFLLSTRDAGRSPSPYIGNGRIGVVIPASGLGASNSFLAGLYEHGPGDVPRIVALPAWNAITVFDGERWLDTGSVKGSVRDYEQTVDMSTGAARTRYDWVNGTRSTSVRVETFASRANPHLTLIRLDLTPNTQARMRVRFAIVGLPPPRRLPLGTLERAPPDWKPDDIWYPGHMVVQGRSAVRRPRGARLSMTSTPVGRKIVLGQSAAVSWATDLPQASVRPLSSGDTAMVEVAFDALPGRTYTFSQIVGIFSSAEGPQPLARATREAEAGRQRGYERLAAENAAAWRRRWETDIEIEGDPALQRVVRSMLFYLLCSSDRGTGLGIPPMGLSSAGYYGHIFWDSDTWMFPSLLLTHPDVAYSLVAFRWRTLPAARANARANGYRGAMYPWEADELGNETTPHFAVQNAKSEIHVNGDVSLAQWQYYLATGDSAWLAREGYPVIQGTAEFWVSRAAYDSSDGKFHIHNVVSVSEGLIGVSDDAYTNAVARKNLEIAVSASKKLGKKADPRWAELAAKLHLPYDSVSEFYRTYEGAPDSTLGDVTPLLAYPLGVPMSDRAKRGNLEPAVRRLMTKGGGALMGAALLSVDAAELGDRDLVDSLLPHSYQSWLQGPFLMLSETPTNKAVNFLTGAGSFLQQVIFGYTGLRLGESGVEPAFPPVLPSKIKRLVIRGIHLRGKRYDVIVDSDGRRMVPHEAAAPR